MTNWQGWHNRLTSAACAWFALGGALCAEDSTPGKTGAAFRQQLAASVSVTVTWENRALRDALAGLSQQLDVAVILDRRIDPGQPIALRLRDQSAEEALKQLSAAAHSEWRAVGPVIFVGPAHAAAKLPTLAAFRRQDAERLPTDARSRLLKVQAWKWDELAEPRRLLDELAKQAGVTVSNPEVIPHDLWPAVSLSPLAWTDRLSLLLAGFDLTFEVANHGRDVKLAPFPETVLLLKSHSTRGPPGPTAAQLRRSVPDAKIHVEQGKLVVAALQEDHEKIEQLLAKQSMPKTKTAKKGPGVQRYSLTIGKNDLAGAVMKKIAEQLDKELKYDMAVLQKLKQHVPVSVKEVTLDELLTATLKPLGLTYKLTEDSLEIVVAE